MSADTVYRRYDQTLLRPQRRWTKIARSWDHYLLPAPRSVQMKQILAELVRPNLPGRLDFKSVPQLILNFMLFLALVHQGGLPNCL
jgi:hypothetical protein